MKIPQNSSNFEVRMRSVFLSLRFFEVQDLKLFEDKTSKYTKFRGEVEASISEVFAHPTPYVSLIL